MISPSITAASGCRFFALAAVFCAFPTTALPGEEPRPEAFSRWLDALTRSVAAAGSDPAAAEASARAALRALPRGDAAARTQLTLGAALRSLGRDAEAALAFGAAAAIPEPSLAARAELEASRARRDAGAATPLLAPEPLPATPPERLRRAGDLLASARPEDALAELDAADAAASEPPAAARSAALRALALLSRGRAAEAGRAARAALESGAADEGSAAAAELALARIAAREGRHGEAIALYRRLSRRRAPVPGLPPRQQRELPEDASFLAAWLPYDAGRFAEAARSLRAWHRAHPGARRADDARWFEAWSTFRTGNAARAREAMARLATGPLEARALYWQARLARSPVAQRRLYRRARDAAGPDGWYGLLAAARLSALGARPGPWELPPGEPPGDGPGEGAAGRALAHAADLFGAGFPGAARAEMAALAAWRGVRPAASRLAQLAALSGDLELPSRLARDHLPPSGRALRWAHPDAWTDLLPRLAAATGVDRQLLLAVARRESSFRGGARSAAGAVGLLQLLPATGERLAATAGLPPARARLADPEVSLAAGALYLGLLADRFGQPAAALAAYNAGPTSAAAWARDLAHLPLDEWVEDLPFRETRQYVKAVLADAQVRRWLYQGADLALDGLAPMAPPAEGVGF